MGHRTDARPEFDAPCKLGSRHDLGRLRGPLRAVIGSLLPFAMSRGIANRYIAPARRSSRPVRADYESKGKPDATWHDRIGSDGCQHGSALAQGYFKIKF